MLLTITTHLAHPLENELAVVIHALGRRFRGPADRGSRAAVPGHIPGRGLS